MNVQRINTQLGPRFYKTLDQGWAKTKFRAIQNINVFSNNFLILPHSNASMTLTVDDSGIAGQ